MILQETTIYRRRHKLRTMQNGLDLGGAYGATLGRIKAQGEEKARLGIAVLMWISHSRRPLQADEICHAIAIQIGSNDLNSDDIPAISTLLGCCQGLVTIEKGGSTVRLIHFTLQEYLRTHPDLFDRPHATMAETCLTYLNFMSVKGLSADSSPNPPRRPFLTYSSLHWGTHMRMEVSDLAKTFALQLLDEFDTHISTKFLWGSVSLQFISRPYYWYPVPDRKGFSALHCIMYFGIAEVANILINMNRWDVNEADGVGVTPLIWAARYGHEEAVRLILRIKHIQPDQQDTKYGRTALSWAAENGHEGVVRIFLGPQFVNLESLGRRWRKTQQIVDMMTGRRYVNPDSLSKTGRTPLTWAAENGHEEIVKLLLGRKDVNPDTPDMEDRRTPLSWAVENRHEEIVKLLLARKDVNPNTPSRGYGGRPLLWATRNGHEGIVKLLLGRKDVNLDTPDTAFGQTPLLLAVWKGHEGVVKLLLGRKDVTPDTPNRLDSRTPLSLAAKNGHEGIVKLLLERGDVNPDPPDSVYGQTPLSWAAGNGHEGVVKLLLGREDVNPDSSDESGRTPLSWAAQRGHEGVMKLLLGQKYVHPDTLDTKYGRTPLSWAVENGHEEIVKLLLGRTDVNPNISSIPGQTPLMLAAQNRQKLIEAQRSQRPRRPNWALA